MFKTWFNLGFKVTILSFFLMITHPYDHTAIVSSVLTPDMFDIASAVESLEFSDLYRIF